MTRITALLAAGVVCLGVALGFFLTLRGGAEDRFAQCRDGAVAGGAAEIGGPFTLTAADGSRVTAADVITEPTLLYFGYTFCPDFCPTDLARNAQAADLLAEAGTQVGQVFVSVDPARDTAEVVGDFAGFIHPDLVGLTGSEADVAEAAGAYRVYYSVPEGGDAFYLVDHSTFTYLVAPEVGFLDFFGSDETPEAMAESVQCFVERL